jgi:hypothetical protein
MAKSRHSPPFSFCCKTQDLVKHKGGLSEKQMHPGTRNGLYTIVLGHIGCIICRVHAYIYNLTNYNYICTHDFGIILDEWYTMVFGIILDEWYTMVFGIILDEWYTMVCHYFSIYHCCGSMHRCLWFSNHSQPGVKFFTSHGATPHRNPRNLRHPTPEKPSPGPHGPQVYHINV